MRLVDKWKNQILGKKHRLAKIQTIHAIYYLVAVVAEMRNLLTVQYPKVDSMGNITIKQENIAKGEIVDMQYYKEV